MAASRDISLEFEDWPPVPELQIKEMPDPCEIFMRGITNEINAEDVGQMVEAQTHMYVRFEIDFLKAWLIFSEREKEINLFIAFIGSHEIDWTAVVKLARWGLNLHVVPVSMHTVFHDLFQAKQIWED